MPDFFKNLKIKSKLFSIAAVFLAGFTLFSSLGYVTLNFIKVNGPLYKQIVRGKDTIADVLPPPKYIIEAYLITLQMLDETNPQEIARLLKDSVRLKREYVERQQFWLKDLPAGELKDELVKFSHQPAEEFFRIRDEEFIPLVLSGQTDKARELARVQLKPLYELHRKHIDRVVTIAREMNVRDEVHGRKRIFQFSLLLLLLGSAVISIGIILLIYVLNQITIPLSKLTYAARKIADGDFSENIIIDSKDELGCLTKDVESMRISLRSALEGLNEEIEERKQMENELLLARQQLEEQVRERTAQLQKTNQELNSEIQEHKQDRERINRLNEDMGLRIMERTSELQYQKEELRNAYEKLKTVQAQLVQSAKMASLGQLAGGVAHEINNPLTGVLNNIQLIKMELAGKNDFGPADFKDVLDIIEESALRCASITSSLLDFSRSAGETFQPYCLNEIVEKTLNLIGHEILLHNIAIEKRLKPDLPLVLGDFQLLQQALFDIIINAQWAIRKKSDADGLITIKTEYEPEKASVSLSISDTGCGIAPEELAKIFDPFFTTKPAGEGTGLGLAIVYSIVKKHSGEIEAVSELGQGATFKISIPALKKEGV